MTVTVGGSSPSNSQKTDFRSAFNLMPTYTVATYAAALTVTTRSMVYVVADETNDNLPTMYFYDGTTLNWLPSVGI